MKKSRVMRETFFACATRLLPLLLLLPLPAAVQAQDYTYTTNNGAITITGYTGSGGAVTIPTTINGLPVTSIGDGAFRMCYGLESVTIPDSVTGIGAWAFKECSSLTNVTIGSSVTSIGDEAFLWCWRLKSVTIPDSVINIGELAFKECEALTNVRIGSSVTSIGDGAFGECYDLRSVSIGRSVINIGAWAFGECYDLTSVTIPDSVTSIGDGAFLDCYSLTNVTIGSSVTSIGDGAFGECDDLTSVTIPDSVSNIGGAAFADCEDLIGVYFKGNAPDLGSGVFGGDDNATIYYLPGTSGWGETFGGRPTAVWMATSVDYGYLDTGYGTCIITNYTGPGGVVSIPPRLGANLTVIGIGAWAFDECYDLTSVTIPHSVWSIGDGAFANCGDLIAVYFRRDAPPDLGSGVFGGDDNATIYYLPGTSGWGETFGGSPTAVWMATSADYGYLDTGYGTCIITNYTGPGGVVSIPLGLGAGLRVTTIGAFAFGECDNLTSVTIPDSVTSIGDGAFDGCSQLESVTIPDSVTSIGGGAFGSCWNLTDVTIGSSVTSIGEWAFGECWDLRRVTIPDSVTSIGKWAFVDCWNLTNVTIGSSVTKIEEWVFKNCWNLANVAIPNSVTNIGEWAFDECWNLESVTIPDSVTSIGKWAFGECWNLTNVMIGSSVTNIGDGAFGECFNLINVTIPDSVTSIGKWAFMDCYSLTNVTIGSSVTSIGDGAFAEGYSLTSVMIPDSVTSIGGGAFADCEDLIGVYFNGNAPSQGVWSAFDSDSMATVYYLAGTTGWGATFGGRPTALWTGAQQLKGFAFSAIPASVSVGQPVSLTIRALDQFGNGFPALNDYVTLQTTFQGCKVNPCRAQMVNGQWQGQVTLDAGAGNIRLSASYSGRSGQSGLFSVTSQQPGSGTINGTLVLPFDIGPAETVVYLDRGTAEERQLTPQSTEFVFANVPPGCHTLEVTVAGWLDRFGESKDIDVPNGVVTCSLAVKSIHRPVIFVPGILGSCENNSAKIHDAYPDLPHQTPASRDQLAIWDPKILWRTGWYFNNMSNALAKDFVVYEVPYDWSMHIDDIWQIYLKPVIEKAKHETGYDSVYIVAHSMGGLVTRAYIQSKPDANRANYPGGYSNDIEKLIMLGTPNAGALDAAVIALTADVKDVDNWEMGIIAPFYTLYEHSIANLYRERGDPAIYGGATFTNLQHREQTNFLYKCLPSLYELANYAGVLVFSENHQGGLVIVDDDQIGTRGVSETISNLNNDVDGLACFVSDRGSDTTKVTTKVLLSNSKKTFYSIALRRSSNNDLSANMVTDWEMGDGTVIAASTEDTESFYQQPFSTSSGVLSKGSFGDHLELVSGTAGIQQVLDFFGVAQSQAAERLTALAEQEGQASVTTTSNTLWLYVGGRVQPCILSPSLQLSGVDPGSGLLVTNIPNCAVNLQDGSSAIEITDVEVGSYTVNLKGPGEDDFTIQLRLVDTNGNDVTQEAMGHYTNGVFSFQFSLYETPTNVLILRSPVPMPENLRSEETNGDVHLIWDAAQAPVNGYRIYAKSQTSPMLSQAGECAAGVTSQILPDQWNSSGTATSFVYYVVSVSASNSESFCVGPVDNRYHAVARFSVVPVDTGDSAVFAFTNQSFGNISQWEWDLDGDGKTDSTLRDPPPHEFKTNGIYVVTLRAIGSNVSDFASAYVRVSRLKGVEMGAGSNVLLRWDSAGSNVFSIYRSTNLLMESGGFELLPSGSNRTAVQGLNVFTDRVDSARSYFYRIDVSQ